MKLTRRSLLKHSLALGTLGLAAGCKIPRPQYANLIQQENAKPGTTEWRLGKTRIDSAALYRCPWIEGYASHRSIRKGESLTLFVNTRPAAPFHIDVFRLGYYGGKGGRRMMKTLGPYVGTPQEDPPVGIHRLRDCQWSPCATFTIPDDWVSGVYVAKLTEQARDLQSYIIFIVRDDRQADFIFQCSDNTWQAYNRWPNQFSLYDNGEHEWWWGGDVRVSFNRPYGKYCQILDAPLSTGSGEWFLWEFPMAYWMESLGYDLSYTSNLDTHRDPQGLLRAKGFLSVGHDEYWTIEMFRNVEAAIQKGLNVGFFSGNAVCGKIQLSPDTQGRKNRTFERIGVFGPPGGTREFESISTLKHEPPYANSLIGAHSTGPVTGGADWMCAAPAHWIFDGTGMKLGDSIPGLVGWEWHGDPAPLPGLEILATAPTQSAPGELNGGQFTATIYPGPEGNFVFNAATCWWADGLSAPPGYIRPSVYTSPQGPDIRVQRITRNVLNRMKS